MTIIAKLFSGAMSDLPLLSSLTSYLKSLLASGPGRANMGHRVRIMEGSRTVKPDIPLGSRACMGYRTLDAASAASCREAALRDREPSWAVGSQEAAASSLDVRKMAAFLRGTGLQKEGYL